MENKKTFKNLSDLVGKGVEVNESPKILKKKEEKAFIEIIKNMCQVEAQTALIEAIGVNIDEFQTPHLNAFYLLLKQQYGETKTSVILWWVFESIDEDGKVRSLIDVDDKPHIINTPAQLYKFLKRYDGQ
jgi:hypothetical protein